jgi:2-keto-3-deoxy-6-phosphogluconate aldolase
MERLIRGAVDFAGRNGAEIVEAFPQETAGRTGYIDAFVGIASCFRRCGFHDIEPRGRWRRAMRCFVR